MVSERIQRRIDRLLDEAEAAADRKDWPQVAGLAGEVMSLDDANSDAAALLASANRMAGGNPSTQPSLEPQLTASPTPALPASFVSGRYRVLRLLGEGGRKRVYLAHDERLDRDVAFAVIKTEGLDAMGRERVQREARAMARIGAHPNLVAIHDIGEEGDNSYLVQEYMDGGDLAVSRQLSAVSADLSDVRILDVAKDVARALAFIHRAGIVHRDLKPANVFLTKDGAAKVGDFGLAMAADLTRITQHGTFVGTVAYMPPEQAVGGDVTAKSDLYSFGALLYELVTGRPPFTGDDPTAIISQHLNTPPVAPSWQRQDCPPGLERVILALLEKDPSKRPADADEVLAHLEKVDPDERAAPRSEGHVLERLARGVFVGREKELERLRKAFDEAFSGRGGLVMLVGEPGIGKTRTAQELETYARMRGAQVLWGRSHEASGAPAFWPWVQVGRSWGAANDVNALTPFLASGGSELVRLFPELRNIPGFSEPPALMDGAAAQFRLFDAFSSFVRTISDAKPAVITLDDLHWADKPTLQLLQHLARELARMRVLVVCTYRDTDLSRTHPLSEALAELNREPGFERVVLRGLSRDEVRNYIAAAANLQPSTALVERIYEETEGNPFFLSEVVNLLTQEGTLANDSVSDIRIPDGVKEALGRRLDRISPEANTLLQVAAVVGREFTYDTLQLLYAGDDDDLLKRIEEGLEARVIEEMEQPGHYRFTHALMQETLLGELSTTRRVRLHGQVGEALERRWGDRADEYASTLAMHFVESSALTAADGERARRYALAAATHAESQFGWSAAVRWYETALAEVPDPDPDELVRYARALSLFQGFGRASWQVQRQALDLYRERGDKRGIAMALVSLAPPHGARDGSDDYAAAVREALDVDADLPVQLRISLRERLVFALITAPDSARAGEIDNLQEEIYRLAANPRAEGGQTIRTEVEAFRATRAGGFATGSELHRSAAREFLALGRMDDAQRNFVSACGSAVTHGDLKHAITDAREMWHAARTGSHGMGQMMATLYLGATLLLLWRPQELLDVERQKREAPLGTFVIDGRYDPVYAISTLNELRGEEAEGCEALAEVQRGSVWETSPRRVQYLARDIVAKHPWVRASEASAAFEEWKEAWLNSESHPQFHRLEAFSLASLFLSHLGGTEFWSRVWADVRHWKNLCGPYSGLAIDAARGQLALRLGLAHEAEQAFNDGVEWAQREGCPVELGRNLQGLAAVAERRGDISGAMTYLELAAGQFAPRGVKLFLDQVIAKKVELQGLSGSDPYTSIVAVSRAVQAEQPEIADTAAPDGTVTLMFSDIEGSTALNERLGDAEWMEVLRAHNALIEEQVQQHSGRVVKTIGDGYMVVFASPEAAVRCALAIQATLVSPSGTLRDVRVRIGLHTGSAVQQGDDFFGREVNYAARVASAAVGGEVLVSEGLKERLPGGEWSWGEPRGATLKGFEGTHEVWPVHRG